jgi:hypothetical protein
MVSVSVLGQFWHPEDKKETQCGTYTKAFSGKKKGPKSHHIMEKKNSLNLSYLNNRF